MMKKKIDNSVIQRRTKDAKPQEEANNNQTLVDQHTGKNHNQADKIDYGVEPKESAHKEDTKFVQSSNCDVVEQIYKLRNDFILIGLTGRTGSGCSTVADILSKPIEDLKSDYENFNGKLITNDIRKKKIINDFIRLNWKCFNVIRASDIIFYYALKENFEDFLSAILSAPQKGKNDRNTYNNKEGSLYATLERELCDDFKTVHDKVLRCENYINNKELTNKNAEIDNLIEVISHTISDFRKKLESLLHSTSKEKIGTVLQEWGNNIRKYDSIIAKENQPYDSKSPACLAHKINRIIKALRAWNISQGKPTHIVIDALRNPYEVLYFRERYSAFYLMSVNATEKVRKSQLASNNYRREEIEQIDQNEKGNHEFTRGFIEIDIDKCIELSDIFIKNDGVDDYCKEKLIGQIFKYISLILHPGLVPPSPIERCMQIAYTAKLNSGCLSRQVGAVVTNENYSVKSIGWNTVAEGQTPCSLRCLRHLVQHEDKEAFSNYELNDEKFTSGIRKLEKAYSQNIKENVNGIPISYCFKDIHNSVVTKDFGNQVHTRSLHAEENSFLQLAKYGSMGIKGGMLFTTASCCELCAKKAYQLGIKQIFYIDSYPGISQSHILESGSEDHRPQMMLFHGAIGRAYINLYNPFVPMKDEIEARTGVKVKKLLSPKSDAENQIKKAKGKNI